MKYTVYDAELLQTLPIEEIFTSVQGEGLDLGIYQTFVRVLGCDLRCVGCDTYYGEVTPKTVASFPHEKLTLTEILHRIRHDGRVKSVCFTGGEFTLYHNQLKILSRALRNEGYWLTLQTDGAKLDDELTDLIQSVNLDIKPPSSKQPARLDRIQFLKPGQQVKVLVGTQEDLEFALAVNKFVVENAPEVTLVLQPYIYEHQHHAQGAIEAFARLHDMVDPVRDKFEGLWRLTLQSHKLIGVR